MGLDTNSKAPFLSALLKPSTAVTKSHPQGSFGVQNIEEFVSVNRKGKSVVSSKGKNAHREGDSNDRSSNVRSIIGETEGMLWHLRANIRPLQMNRVWLSLGSLK